MRIVGGKFRGREIQAPKGRVTRPMSDRTREALFNILGNINGFNVLDAYAGSGAVGLEALSRGAGHVDAVEKSFHPAQVISKNVRQLAAEENYRLFREPVQSWARGNPDKLKTYDLIFFCPPHNALDADLIAKAIHFLKPGSLLVVEHFFKDRSPNLKGVEFLKNVSYGESALSLYRKPS